jgi:hypothetical protein
MAFWEGVANIFESADKVTGAIADRVAAIKQIANETVKPLNTDNTPSAINTQTTAEQKRLDELAAKTIPELKEITIAGKTFPMKYVYIGGGIAAAGVLLFVLLRKK